jgi:hypothetical protein
MNFLAASGENKSVVALQHGPYLGRAHRRTVRVRSFPKEVHVVRNILHTEFPFLEERIRSAGAERSVEVGYKIGEALATFTRAIESLSSPGREPLRARTPRVTGSLAHRQ